MKKIKVLFIAGNGRSGSTVLGIALGQLRGYFAGGELRRIWERSLIENRACGCGVPFKECPTWKAIFDKAYGGMDAIDAQKMLGYREAMTQTKHLPRMVVQRDATTGSDRQQEFIDVTDKLYRAIDEVSGCDVIVDASKWPMYAYMLERCPSVELYMVHLTRDPRAVAFSWTRTKLEDEGKLMLKQSALRSTLYWLAWNPAITYLWNRPGKNSTRYMYLPYEEFVREPEKSIAAISRFVGEDRSNELPFSAPRTLQLEKTHAVAGNEARLASGPMKLRMDDEWKKKISRKDYALVSAMTWPLLGKYGGVKRAG
jgi:hypothetical protein